MDMDKWPYHSGLKTTATFIGNKKRKTEALRLFEDFRESNIEKIEKFVKGHELSSTTWVPDYDRPYRQFNVSYDSDAYAIMFSGGFDSLSLALRHLEKKERVYLLSVGFNYDERCSAWLTAQILKSVYGESNVKFIKLFDTILIDGEGTSGLAQQPICAFYASHMPEDVFEDIKAVECAYVMNDDAISYLSELKAIYSNAMKCHSVSRSRKDFPPMKFPLSKVQHHENICYVRRIEEKYDVIFPTLSAEYIRSRMYEAKNDFVYIIEGECNQDKPNKKCDVHAYIFIEHFRHIGSLKEEFSHSLTKRIKERLENVAEKLES